jgi:hypothetical protein
MTRRGVDSRQVEDVERSLPAKAGGDWFTNIEIHIIDVIAGKARLSIVNTV